MTFRFVKNFYILNIISGMWVKESGREDIIHVVHVNPTISRLSTSTTPAYTAIQLPDNAVSAACIPLSRSLPMAVISRRVLVRSSSPWYRYNCIIIVIRRHLQRVRRVFRCETDPKTINRNNSDAFFIAKSVLQITYAATL